jgi:hypothetical protein
LSYDHSPFDSIVAVGATLLLSACHKSTNSKPAGDPVAAAPPSDLNKGLVLYLPFTNGSMADSSGSGTGSY